MSGYGTATNDTHPRLSDAEMMANLRKENAKLRKLLRDTLPFIAEEADYCVPSECFMYPACCEDTPDAVCLAVARIHERARELGVEVDE